MQSIVGRGITGFWNGRQLRAGQLTWFQEDGVAVSDGLIRQSAELQAIGRTVIAIGADDQVWGLLGIVDSVRPTAAEAIRQLRELNISPLMMLSGDHIGVAQRIGDELGIEYQGGLTPEDKLQCIRTMKLEHGPVGMEGDAGK